MVPQGVALGAPDALGEPVPLGEAPALSVGALLAEAAEPVGTPLPLTVMVENPLAAALAEVADAVGIGEPLPDPLAKLLEEPLREAAAEAVSKEEVGEALGGAEALSKDAVALSEARPVRDGAKEEEAVGEPERLTDGHGDAVPLREGDPDDEAQRVGLALPVAPLTVAAALAHADIEEGADALAQPLEETLLLGEPDEDALREGADAVGGAVALPLREGEADTEGHLLATVEAEAHPEAVCKPEREVDTEAQPLAVLERLVL